MIQSIAVVDTVLVDRGGPGGERNGDNDDSSKDVHRTHNYTAQYSPLYSELQNPKATSKKAKLLSSSLSWLQQRGLGISVHVSALSLLWFAFVVWMSLQQSFLPHLA